MKLSPCSRRQFNRACRILLKYVADEQFYNQYILQHAGSDLFLRMSEPPRPLCSFRANKLIPDRNMSYAMKPVVPLAICRLVRKQPFCPRTSKGLYLWRISDPSVFISSYCRHLNLKMQLAFTMVSSATILCVSRRSVLAVSGCILVALLAIAKVSTLSQNLRTRDKKRRLALCQGMSQPVTTSDRRSSMTFINKNHLKSVAMSWNATQRTYSPDER